MTTHPCNKQRMQRSLHARWPHRLRTYAMTCTGSCVCDPRAAGVRADARTRWARCRHTSGARRSADRPGRVAFHHAATVDHAATVVASITPVPAAPRDATRPSSSPTAGQPSPPSTTAGLATRPTSPEIARLSIDTIRGAGDGRGAEGERGASRARRWRSRRSATCCSRRFLRVNPQDTAVARSRPLRAQRRARLRAAVLAAAPVRLRPRASRTSSSSASGARARPGTPSAGTRPASRSPPGRSGRASPTPSGMAIAERFLAERFNRPGDEVVDHHT